MTNILVFDFEVLRKEWLLVYADVNNQKMDYIRKDSEKLKQLYADNLKDTIWVGYNCRGYDQYIFKSILLGFNPYEVSKWIITDDKPGWAFCDQFGRIPLTFYDAQIDRFKSLKQLEGYMGMDIEECDIPWDLDRELTDEEFQRMLKYCMHDVESTFQVFVNSMADFRAYIKLIENFNLPKRSFCKTKPQLTSKILGANQRPHTDEWVLPPLPDTVKLGRYQYVYNWFKDPANHNQEATYTITAGGIETTIAWGGIHSGKEKYRGKGFIINADVASYYPALVIEYELLSRNCGKTGLDKFREIRDGRIIHKKTDPDLAYSEKIVVNSTYGAMGDKHNGLYDPRNMHAVCMFGQLMLLDLVDKVEDEFEVIQTNTDGIMVMGTPETFDRFKEICADWQARNRMVLEYDLYDEVIEKDVNNYILVKDGKAVKRKGGWVKKCTPLDNDTPILRDGLVECLVTGKSPEQVVAEHTDLIDFQKIIKIGGMYDHCEHNGNIYYNKVYRVFASTHESDGMLKKIKKGKINPEKVGNTPEKCFIMNKEVKGRQAPRKLDKSWYADLLRMRIKDFTGEDYSC